MADDSNAKAKIVSAIDHSLYVQMKNVENIVSLWIILKTLLDGSGFTRKFHHYEHFFPQGEKIVII